MKKRIFALILTLALAVAMMVPGSAATESKYGESFSSVANYNYQLNAYTWGTPDVNTPITVYQNISEDDSQRWIPSRLMAGEYYLLENAANPQVAITYTSRGGQAILTTKDTVQGTNQKIKMVNEGKDYYDRTMYGLVFPDFVLALTATSLTNGGKVTCDAPNGQNNQLWFRGLFY